MKFSGGGLTVSGGEATLQPEFLKDLFKKAQENEIHTCLDTSGFVNIDVIDPVLDYTNLVLLDLAMPKFSGVDVVDYLKKENILDSKNIIIFTASTVSPELFDDLKRRGVKGILKKPVDMNELEDLVTKFRPT